MHTKLVAIILSSNLNRSWKFFYWKILLQICSEVVIMDPTTPCVCCHATLWNNNARKQAVTDKLQGNVATYVRYGGDANNQFKKSLLLSLSVKKN